MPGLKWTGDLLVENGRLGVGTLSPAHEIHVISATSGRIQVQGSSGFGMVYVQGSAGQSAQLQLNVVGSRRWVVVTNSSEALIFSDETAASERMRLSPAGNLLVGTTTGACRITVSAVGMAVAAIQAVGNDPANAKMRLENVGSGGAIWEVIAGRPGANNADFTVYDAVGGVTRLALSLAGDLNVGTTGNAHRAAFIVSGGADRQILQAGVASVSNGFRVLWDHATLKTRVSITDIPTSAAGLPAGTIWSNAGVLNIA